MSKELDKIFNEHNAKTDKLCDEFKDYLLKDFNKSMNKLIFLMAVIAIISFVGLCLVRYFL